MFIPLPDFSSLYCAAAAEAPELASRGVFTEPRTVQRLWHISERLVENGRRFNLTSILEPDAIVKKHLIDSLVPLALLWDGGIGCRDIRALDVGTGAGFPLLPWAAVSPDGAEFVGLDATGKKISHIRETADAAGLASVRAVQARAEEAARDLKLRERFDVVTARAVAALPVLVELCAPFVKVGGVFAALKGRAEEEFAEAKETAGKMGLGEGRTVGYTLPGGDVRTLCLWTKERPTPAKYPRRYGDILKEKA